MIRTAFNNRFRDHKSGQSRSQRPGRRDAGMRRDAAPRREYASVVHPWMSLPERLAATQAAMQELAGTAAFQCPLGEMLVPAAPEPAEAKPKPAGVNIIIRKRRLPATALSALAAAG